MSEAKIIAIGDNVVDKYLSRGKMYPGGQCVNTCVYSIMNGGKQHILVNLVMTALLNTTAKS
nr:hypothetical protein [Clostridium sp. AM51-4]